LPSLFGLNGELVLVRIGADPRHLEDLLEALARLDFPVNPELHHRPGSVLIEFPAYENQVNDVRAMFDRSGIEAPDLEVYRMFASPAA
jgi:hypothetical protein